MVQRRYDPQTGRLIHLQALSDDLKTISVENWPSRPRDQEELVQARLNTTRALKAELENFYGIKTSLDSLGVFQEILAEGIGEMNEEGQQPSLEKVFERVEAALLRPVPVVYKLSE